jgi:ATP-dependent Lon protease
MESKTKIVPLFPLEKVVLFPRALLSIQMPPVKKVLGLGDYIAPDAEICFGLLKQSKDESESDTVLDEIYRTGCIGRVVNKEIYGKEHYRLLVEGIERVRIGQAVRHKPILQVETEILHDYVDINRKEEINQELSHLLKLTRQMGKMLPHFNPIIKSIIAAYPHPAIIADLITYTFIKDTYAKICVLEELDTLRRVRLVAVQMRGIFQRLSRQHNRGGHS